MRRLLRLKQVKQAVGLGTTAIYEQIKKGEFPRPVHIGTRAVAWVSDDIEKWIEERIAASKSNESIIHKSNVTRHARQPALKRQQHNQDIAPATGDMR